jgi:hypothetical protein
LLADILVENLAEAIRAVKDDDVSQKLINEFAQRAANPDAGIVTRK